MRIRRPRLSYANVAATLALVLAASMGGAYAHGKVGSALIKNNAVKSRHIAFQQVKTPDLGKRSVSTNRIKPKAVSRGKLKNNARPKTFMYVLSGGHDFTGCGGVQVNIGLPVSDSAAVKSQWSASMRSASTGHWYHVPGPWQSSDYSLRVMPSADRIEIECNGTFGLNFDQIRVFRTQMNVSGGSLALARSSGQGQDPDAQ